MLNGNKNFNVKETIRDGDGHYIVTSIEFEDKTFTLINVYAPNKDDPDFFKSLVKAMDSIEKRDGIIIGGDFNLVMDPALDQRNSMTNHEKGACVLTEYIDREGLCDIWRIQNPEAHRYTWHRQSKGSLTASRIDFFLISSHWADIISLSSMKLGIFSDHSAIMIEIQFDAVTRGPGVWKLHTMLLQEQLYKEGIRNVIEKTIRKFKPMNPSELWMQIK